MASSLITVSLMCLIAISVVSAQQANDRVTPTPGLTDELQLNSNIDTNTNPNQNNAPINTNDGSQPQQDNFADPPSQNDLIQPNLNDEDFPPQPFNFFGRNNPLSFLFDSMRRHQQDLDQQFQQLEQQASEGEEVSYFSRNGVSYTRTCTTKRVSK